MPFSRYEYRLGRIYTVHRGETPLIYGKAGSSARINEEQRLFQRYIAESVDERHFDFVAGDGGFQFISTLLAEPQKIFGADVCDQVAERAVEGDYFSGQTLVVHGDGLQIEPD